MNEVVTTNQTPQYKQFVAELNKMDGQIAAAGLPSHISIEQFKRVVQTVVNSTPDLLMADRKSLFEACLRCAGDKLLPDGRRAALVPFNTKKTVKDANGQKRDSWIKAVQYIPMVTGLIQLAKGSGMVTSISAQCVFTKDVFECDLASDAPPIHKPAMEEDRGTFVLAYALARFTDGTHQLEIMYKKDIEEVRAISKQNNGIPWTKWWFEMARKSVLRRLLKYMALTPDLASVLDHDDDDIDTSGKPNNAPETIDAGFTSNQKQIDPPVEQQKDEDLEIDADGVIIDNKTGDLFNDDKAEMPTMPENIIVSLDGPSLAPFTEWLEKTLNGLSAEDGKDLIMANAEIITKAIKKPRGNIIKQLLQSKGINFNPPVDTEAAA